MPEKTETDVEPDPVIDTPTEISDTPPAMNGESLYSIYVATRHANFNDGGSYLPWAHLNPIEQKAWNHIAEEFTKRGDTLTFNPVATEMDPFPGSVLK